MPHVHASFQRHTTTARKVFLVDEEFFGYSPNAVQRATDVASALKSHGFRFEIMARVDQVYRPSRDAAWHAERIHLWTSLVRDGLDRVLLGVESGVDTVLHRFNKHTTSPANVLAVRILSSCQVPVRLTYITFDPLMNMDELIESYRFQGRRDILLRPVPGCSSEELVSGIHDDDFVRQHSDDRTFYTEIPYMLVSMECLLESPYLRLVEEPGLAGAPACPWAGETRNTSTPRLEC
jgi:hypothetical protein